MKKFVTSPLTVLVLFILVSFLGYRLFTVWQVYRDLSNNDARLEKKLSFYQSENEHLQEEVKIANTPEAIERDGKARLNMKLPGEKVVVVVPPSVASGTVPSESSFWMWLADFFRKFIP